MNKATEFVLGKKYIRLNQSVEFINKLWEESPDKFLNLYGWYNLVVYEVNEIVRYGVRTSIHVRPEFLHILKDTRVLSLSAQNTIIEIGVNTYSLMSGEIKDLYEFVDKILIYPDE